MFYKQKRVWTYRTFRIPWGRATLWQHSCGAWFDPRDYERGYWCGRCGLNLVTGTKASPRDSAFTRAAMPEDK